MKNYNQILEILVFFMLFSCVNRQGVKNNQAESSVSKDKKDLLDTLTTTQIVTDIDGNTYNTIKIGDRIWMTDNLKTTRFNDGAPIMLATDSVAWASSITPAYCWYNNDPASFKDLYGALYNGFSASSNRICPEHWHVPGDEEWSELTRLLGGEKIAGGKLKESGYDYWVNPNMAASNEKGFSALPGGLRYYDGAFHDLGFGSYFWTSTEFSSGRYWFRYMDYEYSDIFRFNNVGQIGFSVRCIKDY